MLREHSSEVTELEQIAQHLQGKGIKQWALNTLPVLKQHLQKAFNITSVMIIDAAKAHVTQYVPVNQQEKMCIEE